MLKMNETTRAFLEREIPEVLKEEDIRKALRTVSNFMLDYGFTYPGHDLTDLGREAERAYDDLFYSND